MTNGAMVASPVIVSIGMYAGLRNGLRVREDTLDIPQYNLLLSW